MSDLVLVQISRGVAPSVAVVTSVLSYFYSWTSSKVPHHRPPPSTTTTAPPSTAPGAQTAQVGSGVGEEFVAAHRAAQALAAQGFSTDRDFWCCDRLVNVTLQVRVQLGQTEVCFAPNLRFAQRLMRKLSLWELYKLAFSLVAGVRCAVADIRFLLHICCRNLLPTRGC